MISRFVELWDARNLIGQFILRDLRVRYRQALIGSAWAVLMPALTTFTGLGFRFIVGRFSGERVDLSMAAEIATKAVPWAFFAGAIQLASQSLTASASLIGKVHFTREAIPIAAVLGQLVDFAVGMLLVMALVAATGHPPSPQWLWALPIVALLVLFTAGAALLLSCGNLFLRDVKYLVNVLLMFGVFATPVYYTTQMIGPRAASWIGLNPLTPLFLGLERVLLHGDSPLSVQTAAWPDGSTSVLWSPGMLLYAAAWTVVVLALGLIVFRRTSDLFAEWA
jgi:lipopolysaccharide transport system permease protein